ncbi:MAG: HipA domain protein [Gammaproteobacteria bacterium]|nr:MAG: HipA domain protein [Gammaproteobacteria bacterium]
MNAINSILVYLDADFLDEEQCIGLLNYDRGHYSFEYTQDWLSHQYAFKIDPELELWKGFQHPSKSTFGIFLDLSPDRWGRALMDKRQLIECIDSKQVYRQLYDWDYLLGVSDQTRMGAIRLKNDQGEYIDNRENATPPVTSLSELEYVASQLERADSDELPELRQWLSQLMAPGSSLGGARPKANFQETDGSLWIAKFPSHNDKYDVGLWEYIVHILARKSGIDVPDSRIKCFSREHHTFIVKRFDRENKKRSMFCSAMTALKKSDGEHASYLEILEFITDNASTGINQQLEQLWRRMIFNVMVSNRDDHLRNHGFIFDKDGWKLSPAYDINVNLDKQDHTLTFDYVQNRPSIEVLFSVIEHFRISTARAKEITQEVANVIKGWKAVALDAGARNAEISRIESAFSYAFTAVNDS